MDIKGTKTEANLKRAFAGDAQANIRYLYFAAKAEVEGHTNAASLFRTTAEGESGHAFGQLDYLESVEDPVTGMPFGTTIDNLKAAIAGEMKNSTENYPGMAKIARDEGLEEVAKWFETLAKAEKSHANRLQRALDELA